MLTLGNELDAVQNWFQKYLLGSHGFVSALTNGETFWSGLAIFVVSNYTVIVWVIIDLILILSARNISLSSAQLNNEIDLSLDSTKRSTGTSVFSESICQHIVSIYKHKFILMSKYIKNFQMTVSLQTLPQLFI